MRGAASALQRDMGWAASTGSDNKKRKPSPRISPVVVYDRKSRSSGATNDFVTPQQLSSAPHSSPPFSSPPFSSPPLSSPPYSNGHASGSVAATHGAGVGVRHFSLCVPNVGLSYEAEARATFERASMRDELAAEESTRRVTASGFVKRCSFDPLYQRALARAGLCAIVVVPLVLMPLHGFMLANGLDDTVLAAYTLLGAAGVLCSLLAPADAHALPPQVVATPLRLAYALCWLLPPVVLRSVDWAAYCTIPLGVLGLLVVRHPCGCWCADVYVLSMLLAPCACITLAYALDLADGAVAANVSVTEWQAYGRDHGAPMPDAFAFTDGYVATQWRGQLSEWSHVSGTYSREMRAEYGVAPVLPSRKCLVNSTEFPGTLTSTCDVAMVVMYSPKWESAHDGYTDISDHDAGADGGVNKRHSCAISGGGVAASISAAVARWTVEGSGLCVYADPLYRAPHGTPPLAVEECRNLLALHALRPLSICQSQFFVVAHDEDTRRQLIDTLAYGSSLLVLIGVVVGLTRADLSARLRGWAHRCLGFARRQLVAIDMI